MMHHNRRSCAQRDTRGKRGYDEVFNGLIQDWNWSGMIESRAVRYHPLESDSVRNAP